MLSRTGEKNIGQTFISFERNDIGRFLSVEQRLQRVVERITNENRRMRDFVITIPGSRCLFTCGYVRVVNNF